MRILYRKVGKRYQALTQAEVVQAALKEMRRFSKLHDVLDDIEMQLLLGELKFHDYRPGEPGKKQASIPTTGT